MNAEKVDKNLFSRSFYVIRKKFGPGSRGQGVEGFEELKRIVKQGGEFCREITAIIAERAACEAQYAKSLQKCSAKLAKLCSISVGTTAAAWETVADEMNAESETHRKINDSLIEDICKPLKNMYENHSKVRKPIEMAVDKATKALSDSRQEEHKYKCKTFHLTGESEKLHGNIIETRMQTSKKSTDKDLAKMDKKLNNMKEQMRKTGKRYYTSSLSAERSRQDWEVATIKSSGHLQNLEEERLKELQKYLRLYKHAMDSISPQISTACDRISEAIICIDLNKDMRKMVEGRNKGMSHTEQILFETYAEDLEASMEKERRRQNLKLYLYYLSQDLHTEQKGVTGIEKLADIYKRQPDYADNDTVEETLLKARQMHAMVNFLDSSHYKLSLSLSKDMGTQLPAPHKFAEYMEKTKDKSGLPLTLLKIPAHLISEGFSSADFSARGLADGGHDGAPYESISNDGEFSDDEHYEDDFDTYEPIQTKHEVLCRCRVVYDFNSTQSEELTIRTGDVVNILQKHDDGWWRGEMNGATGIFPATYVEEVS